MKIRNPNQLKLFTTKMVFLFSQKQNLNLYILKLRKDIRGLTLIEILIALIVMLIGLVGVLSMFPTGISSSSESIEDRISARIADSVVQALTIAMRAATSSDRTSGTPGRARLFHDGVVNNEGKSIYEFTLPLPFDNGGPPDKPREFAHPDGSDSKPKDIFRLGKESKILSMHQAVISGPDKTDPYCQYGFTFTVSRVDDRRPKDHTGDKYKPLPLYEFKIAIYRIGRQTEDSYYQAKKLPEPIKIFVIHLAGP